MKNANNRSLTYSIISLEIKEILTINMKIKEAKEFNLRFIKTEATLFQFH